MDALTFLPKFAPERHSVTTLHPLKGGCNVCNALGTITRVANVAFVTVVTAGRFLTRTLERKTPHESQPGNTQQQDQGGGAKNDNQP